jgi:hypothetical protein
VGAETRDAGREPSGRSRRSARLPHPSSIPPEDGCAVRHGAARRAGIGSSRARSRPRVLPSHGSRRGCGSSPLRRARAARVRWPQGRPSLRRPRVRSAASSRTDYPLPDRSESATATLVFGAVPTSTRRDVVIVRSSQRIPEPTACRPPVPDSTGLGPQASRPE